jgi:multicomponent Na+:H+ antiporter subunit F
MTIAYAYCLVVVALAALVGLARMEKGPTMLDRVVALDVVTAAVLGSVALISARTARTDLVPVLVVLSIVGFVGSVTIARFAAVEAPEEARILTKEELAEVLAEQRALSDEDAPVHDVDTDDEDDDAAEAQAVDARLDAPSDDAGGGEGTGSADQGAAPGPDGRGGSAPAGEDR